MIHKRPTLVMAEDLSSNTPSALKNIRGCLGHTLVVLGNTRIERGVDVWR